MLPPAYGTMPPMFHSLYNRSVGNAAPTTEPPSASEDAAFLQWPASYLDGAQAYDADTWQLEVGGLVERPQDFNLKDLQGFMRIQQNRRLVFADGWTYRATWEGFVVQELLHRVMPLPEARFLVQTNLSGHVECLPLKELYAQRALFCLRANGKSLSPLYGGPLRLMVFDRYAHKGLGQLCKLELSADEVPGHFSQKGYSPEGLIEPGDYYAADLHELRPIKSSEEVTQW